MHKIWQFLIFLCLLLAIIFNEEVINFEMISKIPSLFINRLISLSGLIIFWSGILKICEESKFYKLFNFCFKNLFKVIFETKDEKVKGLISLSLASNILGLGSAGLVYGLKAIKCLKEDELDKDIMMLGCLNCGALCFVPVNLTMYRKMYNGITDVSFLIKCWLVSVISFVLTVLILKVFFKLFHKYNLCD